MKRHLAYLKYLLKHKWYVFYAGRQIKVGLFQLIIHDWQKFLPCEYRGYVKAFYTINGKGRSYHEDNEKFQYGWNHHQKHCKHHWQYWVLVKENSQLKPLKIPHKYIKEMIADWYGAGKAITGKWEAAKWYKENNHNMTIHEETKKEIEKLLLKMTSLTFIKSVL